MIKQKRQMITHGQKIGILIEHVQGKIPISDLCQKHNIQPQTYFLKKVKLF